MHAWKGIINYVNEQFNYVARFSTPDSGDKRKIWKEIAQRNTWLANIADPYYGAFQPKDYRETYKRDLAGPDIEGLLSLYP